MGCRKSSIWIAVWIQMILCFKLCDGAACTWPTEFANNVFLDSMKGELTFTDTGMTGYELTAHFTHAVNDWECFDTSYYTSEGLLIIRSTSTFFAFQNFYTYICLHIQKITDVSYRYYHVQGQQLDAGQHRVYFIDTGTTNAGKTDICNSALSATGSEFGLLILKGSEADAKITCPSMLLGRFNFTYTDAASVEQCTSTTDTILHMNVCTNKTTLAFDEPCSQSIVYAAGEVHCVDAVTTTDTYVALYNPQATVDGSTTYRFSCMAISADGTKATIVPNNCTNHQTNTFLARDYTNPTNIIIVGGTIALTPYVLCQGGCTWPTEFQDITFYDNTRGSLVFTTTTMTGFTFTAGVSTVANWECLDETAWTSEKTLLLKSTDTFASVGLTWVSYLCLKFTEVSAGNSYYYYQYHDAESRAADERVYISNDGALTSKATICSASTVPNAAFHFIVKSSAVSAAKQYCAPALLAKMGYVHTAVGGTATCDVTTSNWDVCSDRMVMTFNYTACSTQMASSTAGVVWCMANITSTHQYAVVYNTDSSPTKRFSCFVVSADGTTASMVYDECRENQTPTTLAKDASGTDIGALITMTATETCPFLGPSTTTLAATAAAGSTEGGGTDIIPIVVGVVVGVIAVAAIVAVTIYCIKKKKRVAHGDTEKQKPPDGVVSNGHTPGMTVEEVDNPALTANPEPNTLTPIPHPVVADAHPALPPIRQ